MIRYQVTRDTRLDILVARLLGSASGGTVEAVLAANPGLAAHGAVVPAGTVLLVPEVSVATATQTFPRVWE